MKKLLKFFLSRMFISVFILIAQVFLFLYAIWKLSNYFVFVYIGLLFLTVIAMLYLLTKPLNPSYKVAWLIVLLMFPGLGALVYFLYGTRRLGKKQENQLLEVAKLAQNYRVSDKELLSELKKQDADAYLQAKYLSKHSLYAMYENTTSEYLCPGEVKFERLIEDMKAAKHYIFLEYFIIDLGQLWSEILDVLAQKVKEGVEVRVIYDDVGCLNKLPYGYERKLQALGIQCVVFNPLGHVFNIRYNNRDHRKIAIIDGYIGYMGGINIGDEYVNINQHLGHWKDSALRLNGEAVWNLTLMFCQIWNYSTGVVEDLTKYKPTVHHREKFESDGYVLPFGDSPLDDEIVGEMTYLNMINRAKEYVYICSPYLIVDNEIVTALCLAAKSGVDVRITTPHIPDKWYVHILSRGYYRQLIESGVKIFEYTPGFLHAKSFVCDDKLAVVGTINLDFRSLYLHFESAVWLYKTKSVTQVKVDYEEMLKVSQEISLEECNNVHVFTKMIRAILSIFAPLM